MIDITYDHYLFLLLIQQQSSHAVGYFAQNTMDEHYFHTDKLN